MVKTFIIKCDSIKKIKEYKHIKEIKIYLEQRIEIQYKAKADVIKQIKNDRGTKNSIYSWINQNNQNKG